ncbi:hypothetical protein NKI36_08760 [Mesorhizobium caraganae]|uniref:Uncharacterized protein n=1 Tax=Mesorhizobium caraganae TaxID=483206 RepID=A0ABV1YWJ8_9HYPH
MSLYTDIYSRYEREVLELLPALEQWWSEIASVKRGKTARDDRWPLGLSGHPRFIAIYRRYMLEILRLNDEHERKADEPHLSKQELWEKGKTDDGDRVAKPQSILIEDLIQRNPALRDHFQYFMFIPIGADDFGELYGEG